MSIEIRGPAPSIATSPATSSAATPAKTPSASGEPSAFARVLRGLGREINSGESMMRGALGASTSGRDLSPGELLALQAGVYRYSEAVDLAAKLVDRATSGVKTVMQGGGQ
jgi:hypothetical protein